MEVGYRISKNIRISFKRAGQGTNWPTKHTSKTHQTTQGRNDVRDAKADVTDMRAMPQTQRVRSKNRAFSLDEENEVSAFLLKDVFKILLSRITDAFPFHRKPWRPWGALENTWK